MAISATERVQVVSPGQTHLGKQGFVYGSGASAETAGAQQICMNVLPMPAGAKAKVHIHKGIETIADLLAGDCAVYHRGEGREARRGARRWKRLEEGIVLLPELDKLLGSK